MAEVIRSEGSCICYASHGKDCKCGVDWTPAEVYALQKENIRLRFKMLTLMEGLSVRKVKHNSKEGDL
jgi:hypothetical protein